MVLFVLDVVIGRGTLSTKPDSFLDPNAMTKFSISMALAVGTPALIIIFGIFAFINIRKLFYQVSNNAAVRARAEDIGVTNFRREEERLDISYNITNDRIRGLEILLKEKKDALEVLQTERAIAERKAREERVAQGEQISYEIVKHEKKVEWGEENGNQ